MSAILRCAKAAVAAAAIVIGVVGVAPAAGAATKTYQYSFTNKAVHDQFIDTAFCSDAPASVSIVYNEALHVSALEPGLTQDQIEALLDEDDAGVLTKVTYLQTGTFTLVDSSTGVTYAGHFSIWFGGAINSNTNVFTATFSIEGTGDDGSHISGSFPSHATFVGGHVDPVVLFDKGHLHGCPTTT